jgi:dolichol-phosphate mannosyltransferase
MRIEVVMATYNEADCIESAIVGIAKAATQIRQAGDEVRLLLLDDESPDGTAELAVAAAHVHGLTMSVSSHPRAGLGAAYLRGFDEVLKRGWADTIVTLDADGQHDPLVMPDLLHTFRESTADLVIGSRWTTGGEVPGLSLGRQWMSRLGILCFSMATGVRGVRDATTSYRVFTTEVARSFDPGPLAITGYSFFSSFVGLASAAGFTIREHPIVFSPRIGGTSKLTPKELKQFAANLPRLGLQVRSRRRRPPQVLTRSLWPAPVA